MSKQKNVELLHQKEELDILEAIYMHELELHNSIPPYKFSVQCRPYLDFSLDEALERFAVQLEVELGEKYPQESPRFEIKHHIDKITNSEMKHANSIIEKTAQDMKGTPMLFEIIESIRGWLQNNIVDPELRPKKLRKKNADDELGLDEDFENEEIVVNLTKKETYTMVTKDSFLVWKAKFDAEMEAVKKTRGEVQSKEEKLSGKQLFERDMKLISSDALYNDENDVEEMEDYQHDEEEEKENADEEERVKKLFYYNEDLFEGDVDIDDD